MAQKCLIFTGWLLIFAKTFVLGGVMVPGEQCNRNCVAGDNRVCYFKFILEHYHAMGPACVNCEKGVEADCNNRQCIVGDGFQKGVMSINRTIPGPPIHVCKGDRVVVDVVNMAQGTAAAIHWHGLHMKETPYMDGVPYITQCPIAFGNTFRYDFYVPLAGSNFYHSHSGHHKLNGQYGALIVREPRDKCANGKEYNFDLPEHYVLVTDWRHDYAEQSFPGLPKGVSFPQSFLINGRGTFIDPVSLKPAVVLPVTKYFVRPGASYLFRFMSSVSLTCSFEVTIESHKLTVIATDGYNCEPFQVESLVINAGERYDVVIDANRGKGDYFIRVRGLESCQDQPTDTFALLRYVTRPEDTKRPQPPFPAYNKTYPTGYRLNHPSASCFDNDKEYCAADLTALEEDSELVNCRPDVTLYLTFTNYVLDNKELFASYDRFDNPFDDVTAAGVINNMSLTLPPTPILTQYSEVNPAEFCEPSRWPARCQGKPICYCTYNRKIKNKSIVELILIDDIVVPLLDHPFHLHGFRFAVMAIGKQSSNRPAAIERSRSQKKRRPPFKDTVSIPEGGYAILRFRADNPGFWMFHCHYQMHLQTGMSMIFQVGETSEMAQTPRGFPKCGNYVPELR